jgi:hypothetical protein
MAGLELRVIFLGSDFNSFAFVIAIVIYPGREF